ncbi:MAG: glycosyltransferase [Acidimicrobiales bacterium]
MSAPAPTDRRQTVVVVHWNQPDACAATIDAFRAQALPAGTSAWRFLVVDNASRPELRARLAEVIAAPDVEIVANPTNSGFSGGANAGLRRWLAEGEGEAETASDWVLLCPHDVSMQPDCAARLVDAAAAEPMAGLACADVGDGHVPYIDPYFGGITMPLVVADGSPEVEWHPADYPHGTLMALRRACLREIGLFDESYFAYCEEADLALRARRAGWTCGLVRGARVQNVNLGSSVALVDYLQQRNTLRLVRAMSGRYHAAIRTVISLGQITHGVVRPERAPLVFDARARLYGIRDFLLGRSGPPPAEVSSRR